MAYLVTGGAGFIGSHLVERLLSEGAKVVVVDDLSSGKEENLPKSPNLHLHVKSINDDLSEIFEKHKIDAVFHLAAIPKVQFSIQNPEETHDVNVNGTLNILDLCRRFGVKRFVLSSSAAVYGTSEKLPNKESDPPSPLSPYALHKLIGEQYCKLFNLLYGMETVCLRYFNVYGPRQNPAGDYATLIPKFISMISKGIAPTINGDGEQTRDFVSVFDVVEANILAAKTANKDCFGQVFNVGTGKQTTVNEVGKIILKLSKQDIELKHGPSLIEPRNSLADISKSRSILGWSPKVSFEEGLKITYDFFANGD